MAQSSSDGHRAAHQVYPTRVDTELVARMRALEAAGPRTPIIAPIFRNSYSQAPVPPQSTAGGICLAQRKADRADAGRRAGVQPSRRLGHRTSGLWVEPCGQSVCRRSTPVVHKADTGRYGRTVADFLPPRRACTAPTDDERCHLTRLGRLPPVSPDRRGFSRFRSAGSAHDILINLIKGAGDGCRRCCQTRSSSTGPFGQHPRSATGATQNFLGGPAANEAAGPPIPRSNAPGSRRRCNRCTHRRIAAPAGPL